MLDTGRLRPDVQPLVIIATIKKTTGTRTMRGPSRRRLPGASSVPEASKAGTSARCCDGTRSPPLTRVTIGRHHDFVAERSSRGRLFTPSHPLDVDGPPRAFVKTPCYSAFPRSHPLLREDAALALAAPRHTFVRYWLPVLTYVAMIFTLSAQPHLRPPFHFQNADKVVHMTE